MSKYAMKIQVIVPLCALFIFLFFSLHNKINGVEVIEHYTKNLSPICSFLYQSGDNPNPMPCSEPVSIDPSENIIHENALGNDKLDNNNLSLVSDNLQPSVNHTLLDNSRLWKYKINSDSGVHKEFSNVGEPSFASNGSLILFAGNHYTGRLMHENTWESIDPNFDFKGKVITGHNFTTVRNTTSTSFEFKPLFKADQRILYDPLHKMYIWIRQSIKVFYGNTQDNFVRLAVSNDTRHWVSYDLIPTRELSQSGILRGYLDYPDAALTNKYFYLTTTVFDTHLGNKYGFIARFSLDDLANSLNHSLDRSTIPLDIILDRSVEEIAPVYGASDPMYFGAHSLNESSMNLYSWYDNSSVPFITKKLILPWISINDNRICNSNPYTWWCKANTDSRIRSSWISGNSINFMWNAVGTYDNGVHWIPYVDSATFIVQNGFQYCKKYVISEQNTPWIFGSAYPDNNGNLGSIAYYFNMNTPDPLNHPYLNLAFGIYNTTVSKWNMVPLINSTYPLPVNNIRGNPDYNFGDFLTIKRHAGNNDGYRWDIGAYVITGKNYYDVDPYFIKIK